MSVQLLELKQELIHIRTSLKIPGRHQTLRYAGAQLAVYSEVAQIGRTTELSANANIHTRNHENRSVKHVCAE